MSSSSKQPRDGGDEDDLSSKLPERTSAPTGRPAGRRCAWPFLWDGGSDGTRGDFRGARFRSPAADERLLSVPLALGFVAAKNDTDVGAVGADDDVDVVGVAAAVTAASTQLEWWCCSRRCRPPPDDQLDDDTRRRIPNDALP